MKIARVALFAVIFMALINSPAAGDIGIVVRVAFSKVQTVSEDNVHSERIAFEDGKAVWEEYGDFYFAFYSEEALEALAGFDSTYVVLAPCEKSVKPAFGNLYFVTKNILWGVGEYYGLDSEVYYVWPVKFLPANIGIKDETGNLCHKGVAPFGDYAISEIKKYGQKITKDSFALLANGN